MNEKLIASYPAYNIFLRDLGHDGLLHISVSDTLGLQGASFYRRYSPGSLISYCMKEKLDPIGQYERAKILGHKLHWLNQNATCLTSHREPPEHVIRIEVGQMVKFEGKVFKIVKEPNDNLGLEAQ